MRDRSRILALGDSYTIGETVGADQRWPVQLAGVLRKEGKAVEDPQIIARTGWTTDELDRAIDDASPNGPFDPVTLPSESTTSTAGRSADQYRAQFRGLLARAIAFCRRRRFPGDRGFHSGLGVTPFAEGRDRGKIGRQIDQFNAIAAKEAARSGARFVDITPISNAPRPKQTSRRAMDCILQDGCIRCGIRKICERSGPRWRSLPAPNGQLSGLAANTSFAECLPCCETDQHW